MLIVGLFSLLFTSAQALPADRKCQHYLHSPPIYDAIIDDLAYVLRMGGPSGEDPKLRRNGRESLMVTERLDAMWAFRNHEGRYIHFDHFILAAFRAAELDLHFRVHFPFPLTQRLDREPGWPTGPDFIGMADGRRRPPILYLNTGMDVYSNNSPRQIWMHARQGPVVVLLRPTDGTNTYESRIIVDEDGQTIHRRNGRRGQLDRWQDEGRIVAWFTPWREYRQYDRRLNFVPRAQMVINGIRQD